MIQKIKMLDANELDARARGDKSNPRFGFCVNPRNYIILSHFENRVFVGRIAFFHDFRGGEK